MQAETTFLEDRIHRLMKMRPEQYTGTVTVLSKGQYEKQELPHYTNVFVTEYIEGVPQKFEAIAINFTDIQGRQVYLEKGAQKGKPYQQLRWKAIPPNYSQDSKYKLPGKNGTRPFFPQYLKDFYASGMQYDHLCITEGAFKADVATIRGLFTVGLTSITHSADAKDKDAVHNDIVELIEKNGIKRITVLWDGDCRAIGKTDIERGNDTNRRPRIFYKTVRSIKEKLRNCGYTGEVWFACPRTLDIPGHPKGLDDLFLTGIENKKIISDLQSPHEGETEFFYKLNISADITKLTKFFLQDGVDVFYNYHRALLKDAAFVWEGSKYKYDETEGKCIRLLSVEMKEYMRVGDKYYRKYSKPSAYGGFDEVIEQHSKQAIVDDYGKEIIKHLPKYKSFVVQPDHFNHIPIIHDCYNRYHPFTHTQEECDLEEFEKNSYTFKYIQHAFGPHEHVDMPDHTAMFLDYMKLLYEKPTTKLPAPCLVSIEKNTGKSTLLRWLRAIYTNNMVVVGNQTFHDQFNGTWSSKLIVGIDEAIIESQAILEMIKSLMTDEKAIVRRMNTEGVPEDFFAKFIFTSNNVVNFIRLDEQEDRFWVRYVPSYKQVDVEFEKKLFAEIPQFLFYLANRTMKYPKACARFWFPKADYRTSATDRVIEGSRSHTERNIEEAIERQFDKILEADFLWYTKKELAELVLNNVGEREQIRNIRRALIHMGYPEDAHSIKYITWSCIGENQWQKSEVYGRAYKFKRGTGKEIFAPAKQRTLSKEKPAIEAVEFDKF